MTKPKTTQQPNVWQQYAAKTSRRRSSWMLEEAHPELSPLVDALRDVDESNGADKAALIDELKTSASLRDQLLGDLLARYDLTRKKGRGRPHLPAYAMSDPDMIMSKGNGAIDPLLLGDDRLTLEQACEYVAWNMGSVFTAGQLREFRTGRRRSVRKR